MDVPFLLPHEFLFLLCNCEDRLKLIRRIHNPELVSQKEVAPKGALVKEEAPAVEAAAEEVTEAAVETEETTIKRFVCTDGTCKIESKKCCNECTTDCCKCKKDKCCS